MANQQQKEQFYGGTNQFGQQNQPLPNNFLESDDSIQADQDMQQRIISGEYVPEPAEYCNVGNEIAYTNYDPFVQSSAPQFHHQYQQMQPEDTYSQQYAQMEDPWLNVQHEPNVYAQEEFDADDQYMYQEQTALPSSSTITAENNNPFEEEDDEEEPYEPRPITKIIPMRRIGQPPSRLVVISRRSESGEGYDPEYSMTKHQGNKGLCCEIDCVFTGLRRPLIRSAVVSEAAARRLKQPRKQQFRRDTMDDDTPYL